jgi:large subunit ribosomal protein L20
MRVKGGTITKQRHKKTLAKAKGSKMSIRKRFKLAKQAELHAGEYAFHGRKLRKRDMRTLWIQRINAALKQFDLKYSQFINLLAKKNITLNRKMLADLALNQPKVFEAVVKKLK